MCWGLQLTFMRCFRQRGEKYGCATISEGGSSLQRRFAIRMPRCGGSGALQPGEGGSPAAAIRDAACPLWELSHCRFSFRPSVSVRSTRDLSAARICQCQRITLNDCIPKGTMKASKSMFVGHPMRRQLKLPLSQLTGDGLIRQRKGALSEIGN